MKTELDILFKDLDGQYHDKSIKEIKKDLAFINSVLDTKITAAEPDQEHWADAIILGTFNALDKIRNKEIREKKIEIISNYIWHRH
jgi:ribosomal protein L29